MKEKGMGSNHRLHRLYGFEDGLAGRTLKRAWNSGVGLSVARLSRRIASDRICENLCNLWLKNFLFCVNLLAAVDC
jgi:hypothetical protein